jgi:hypothetical protein
MKTIEELKKMSKDLLVQAGNEKKKCKELNKKFNQKKYDKQFLVIKDCIAYLETNPREEFIQSESERVDKAIAVLSDRFGVWQQSPAASKVKGNLRKNYENNSGITQMKIQLKVLNFILNK